MSASAVLSSSEIAPHALPPLSDACARLLALSEEDALNLRILELLAMKDPAAVARLLALANTPFVNRSGKDIVSLNEALRLLGATATREALLSIWATEFMSGDSPDELSIRDFLIRHIFSICMTMRKLAVNAGITLTSSVLELQLFALVDKVTLSLVLLSDKASPAYKSLRTAVAYGINRLHQMPPLERVFYRAPDLAKAWGLSSALVEQLSAMAQWRRNSSAGKGHELVSLMLVAEILCDSEAMERRGEACQSVHCDVECCAYSDMEGIAPLRPDCELLNQIRGRQAEILSIGRMR